nr:retrovirus-related Pol polyprotein from transposon TNT 1-94 [Tanacetum cinerariifolium]
MANLLEDIQCASSHTRPPMLDRTDFASWQQCIRLYCQGKENGVNILKSINEGPFWMGTLRETLTEGTEGAPHLGPEQPRVYSDLTTEENERFVTVVKLNRGLRDSNYDQLYAYLKQHEAHANEKKMMVHRREDRGTMHRVQVQLVMGELRTELGMLIHVKQGRLSAINATENGVALDEEQLLFIADYAHGKSIIHRPCHDEAGLSYDSDILSEVHDHDHYQDTVCKHHEVHEMHDDVQPNYDVDSHADYMSDNNMILYDQYVNENAVPVVQSNISFVSNDAYMMIVNDMHEQPTQHVFVTTQNKVVNKSLTTELAIYKEQVKLYERRAKFKLTEREQKIDEQLRIVITDRNIKEENLKKELHSVKKQLAFTINHNKSMVEEVTSLKKDFKQKENKYLEEFLDMKALKEKRTTRAPYVSPVQSKFSLPYTHNKIRIRPPDYSKENFLVTFTLQTQLTHEQIFWSKDVLKIKIEALKEQSKAAKPVKALTLYPPNTPIKLVPKETLSEADRTLDFRVIDFQITQLTKKVSVLQEQNELFRVENEKFKQHYKELYDSLKITRAKHIDQTTALLTENENLKVQINAKLKCVTIDSVTPKVLAPEEAKVERPLDRSLASACLYTKHSQELLEYIIQIVLWYLDSGCSKHMTGDRSRLRNFVKKFIRTVRFGNDHFGAIIGYGDYVIGNSMISKVYYVEGHGHNLFSVKQFYDSNMEVAFKKHSCYVRDSDGVELIKGSRGSNLYRISVEDMMKSSLICLLSKASKTKSWLWHHCLNHLNFGTINDLARKDLVRGLPRLKFKKDHLCSACQLEKRKKHTHSPKTKNTNLEVLNTLHMDLCGPMRVQIINGKKYILVIVDDYTRFTWDKFLRSKEAVATACYTQNQSVIHTRHNKTPYELVHNKKPDLTFLRVFGTLCYPANKSEDLGN